MNLNSSIKRFCSTKHQFFFHPRIKTFILPTRNWQTELGGKKMPHRTNMESYLYPQCQQSVRLKFAALILSLAEMSWASKPKNATWTPSYLRKQFHTHLTPFTLKMTKKSTYLPELGTSVFFNFGIFPIIKNHILAFFIKLVTYFCTSPI